MDHITVEKTNKYLIVRIPIGSVENSGSKLSSAKQSIRASIDEGLHDIAAKKVFGPFKRVGEFKKAVRMRRIA